MDDERLWFSTKRFALVVAIIAIWVGVAATIAELFVPAGAWMRQVTDTTKVIGAIGLWGIMMPLALIYIYSLSRDRGPLAEWFYLFFAAPFILFLTPAAALSFLNDWFNFHPKPWPPDVWYKIQIDFALNGALFDFAESFDIRVTDFEPQNGKWAFAIVEAVTRTLWSAWSAGVLFRLFFAARRLMSRSPD